MAYSTPTRWAHGDTPTAVKLQPYSDDLNYIHALAGDKLLNIASPQKHDAAFGVTTDEGEDLTGFCFKHVHRWLTFKGDGTLADINESADSVVSLSEVDSTYTTYDLDSVSWLSYGEFYIVRLCTMAVEHRDAT